MEQSNAFVDRNSPAYSGQMGYTEFSLRMYDFAAYRISGPVLWRFGKHQLVALYNELASGRHLDIGVATGALLDQCQFPVSEPDITLMDLNPKSLSHAARRLRRYAPRIHQANVLEPWGLPPERFGSVAMMNVLHCVPGNIEEKAVAFAQAREVLVPGGTLFGATVLGRGVKHTRLSSSAMRRLNKRGLFCNLDDSLEDLEAVLGDVFVSHELHVQGAGALFVAQTAGNPGGEQ